ncbi:transcriptional regulator [Pseudodesulfovibrio senegalensis]|jgi:YHS domain-containing protein|uniref:Transcriptional regulator n=1 Tax=Pseudodesulfovibrio senegalensis TaxID=1721087 RepID=A0A6N6N6X9_9BACT|nr:transcriptional regulator [Pseudodesulfovibrio senegalensis]KAB1443824.1 transcriptional regulator [Pseudodesulfovibrio senegalensis]
MLKFIIIGLGLFFVYKLFMGDKRKREMQQEKTTKQKMASGELIKDPVCGTYVNKDGDIRVREGEKVHVFCSYECRDKYLKQIGATDVIPEKDEKDA